MCEENAIATILEKVDQLDVDGCYEILEATKERLDQLDGCPSEMFLQAVEGEYQPDDEDDSLNGLDVYSLDSQAVDRDEFDCETDPWGDSDD